jgi:hypothetical protein
MYRTGGASSRSASSRNGSTASSPANTGARSRLVWAPGGTEYQAFAEAPYKDEFDEWLARIICYAFSLPSTAFAKQVFSADRHSAAAPIICVGDRPAPVSAVGR